MFLFDSIHWYESIFHTFFENQNFVWAREICNAFGVGIVSASVDSCFSGVHYLSSEFCSSAGTICILPLFLIVFLSALSPRSHANTRMLENNESLAFPCAVMISQALNPTSLWYFKDYKEQRHFHPVCEHVSVCVSAFHIFEGRTEHIVRPETY